MIEIFKEFTSEAAHQLGRNVEPGHRHGNLHGHSFKAEIYLRGEPDPRTGWICDLAEVEAVLEPIRKALDHRYLNDVEGLELPTLENITRWIARPPRRRAGQRYLPGLGLRGQGDLPDPLPIRNRLPVISPNRLL